MLEWKSRLVILLTVAALLAVALGSFPPVGRHNYGW
jgi:hypothetical protein